MNNKYRVKILQKCGFDELIAKKIDSMLLVRSFITELKEKNTKCKKEYELDGFTYDIDMNPVSNFHYTHIISPFCHGCKKYYFRKPQATQTMANFESIDAFISGGAFSKGSYLENLIYFTCNNCYDYLDSVCYYCKITYLDTKIKNPCKWSESIFNCICYPCSSVKINIKEFFERVNHYQQK